MNRIILFHIYVLLCFFVMGTPPSFAENYNDGLRNVCKVKIKNALWKETDYEIEENGFYTVEVQNEGIHKLGFWIDHFDENVLSGVVGSRSSCTLKKIHLHKGEKITILLLSDSYSAWTKSLGVKGLFTLCRES